MIILHEHKWIYVATPKTGTRSMINWLETHFPEGIEKIGPPSHHVTQVPDHLKRKCKGYRFFTTVRSPYSRMVSLWWSTCMRETGHYHFKEKMEKAGAGNNERLEAFVSYIVRHPSTHQGVNIGHWGTVPQVDFLGSDFIPNPLVLKMEELPYYSQENVDPNNCLMNLPFATPCAVADFPYMNRSVPGETLTPDWWHAHLTPRIIRMIDQWGNEDFVRFQYSRLRSCAYSRQGGLLR